MEHLVTVFDVSTKIYVQRTSVGHHKQAVGNDAGTVQLDDGSTATEASFTKPLKISLSAGKYCDGKNDVEIAGCAFNVNLKKISSLTILVKIWHAKW